MSESSSGTGDRETGSSWCSLATRMVGTRGLAFTVGSGVTPLLHSCNFDRENVPGLKLYKESKYEEIDNRVRIFSKIYKVNPLLLSTSINLGLIVLVQKFSMAVWKL